MKSLQSLFARADFNKIQETKINFDTVVSILMVI